jgi:AcrR family transcriptional regulator
MDSMASPAGKKKNVAHQKPEIEVRALAAKSKRPSKKAQQSAETKDRIIDAAEGLLADYGFYGVTIRMVAEDAGIDTSLLHYHFVNKQGLFDAVLQRRADVVNHVCVESMEAYLKACAGKVTVEGALEAYVRPILNFLANGDDGWRNYFALLAQISNASTWGGAIMAHHFDPMVKRFIELLRIALPGTASIEFYWSYHFFVGSLMSTLANTGRIEPLSGHTVKTGDIASLEPRLLTYAAAGIRHLCATDGPAQTRKSRSKKS